MKVGLTTQVVACSTLAVLSSSCQRDQIAPNCFFEDPPGTCIGPAGPGDESSGDVSIECGSPPLGAVSAAYSYRVDDFEGPDSLVFQGSGLPPGLSVGAGGEIYGTPTEEGVFEAVVIQVTDTDSGASAESACDPITINPQHGHDLFDLPDLAPNGCVPVGGDIMDHLSGGDDSPITCSLGEEKNDSCLIGEGNGLIPDGINFDSDACAASGSITDSRHGTFVWIVQVEQSGFVVDVPFCATNTVDDLFHDVAVLDGGSAHDAEAPFIITYDPQASLVWGSDSDPRFEVTEACANGSCVNWGVQVDKTCSPFDEPFFFGEYETVQNGQGDKIGFAHHATSSTQGVDVQDQPAGDRTWVVQYYTWYCTTDLDSSDCDQDIPGAVMDNAQSQYTWALIARPE
jgi:hypothetical protein